MQSPRLQIGVRRQQKIPQILSQIKPVTLPERVELECSKPHDKPEALRLGGYDWAWRSVRWLFHGSKDS
jgi:hypothetical protein